MKLIRTPFLLLGSLSGGDHQPASCPSQKPSVMLHTSPSSPPPHLPLIDRPFQFYVMNISWIHSSLSIQAATCHFCDPGHHHLSLTRSLQEPLTGLWSRSGPSHTHLQDILRKSYQAAGTAGKLLSMVAVASVRKGIDCKALARRSLLPGLHWFISIFQALFSSPPDISRTSR